MPYMPCHFRGKYFLAGVFATNGPQIEQNQLQTAKKRSHLSQYKQFTLPYIAHEHETSWIVTAHFLRELRFYMGFRSQIEQK